MIRNLTRVFLPKISWQKIKNKILSKDYDLSLVFAADREMARINRKYRGKSVPTNVLSFALDRKSGEIFIGSWQARREAEKLNKSFRQHLIYLYIHALLHLKGFKHDGDKQSKIMNRAEKKWLKILF